MAVAHEYTDTPRSSFSLNIISFSRVRRSYTSSSSNYNDFLPLRFVCVCLYSYVLLTARIHTHTNTIAQSLLIMILRGASRAPHDSKAPFNFSYSTTHLRFLFLVCARSRSQFVYENTCNVVRERHLQNPHSR